MKSIKYIQRNSCGAFKEMHYLRTIFCDTIQKINSLFYCFRNGYVVKVISNDDYLGETLEDALSSSYAKYRQESVKDMWQEWISQGANTNRY